MNNFEKAKQAIEALSVNDKKKLSGKILTMKTLYEVDPVGALLKALQLIQNDFTDERKQSFDEEWLKRNVCPTSYDSYINEEYINWLISHIQTYGFIDTDAFKYTFTDVPDEVREKVKNLQLFYRGIDRYSRENNIEHYEKEGTCCWHNIMYNNILLRVSVYIHGGGYTCSIIDSLDGELAIDFNHIIDYYKKDNGISRTRNENIKEDN